LFTIIIAPILPIPRIGGGAKLLLAAFRSNPLEYAGFAFTNSPAMVFNESALRPRTNILMTDTNYIAVMRCFMNHRKVLSRHFYYPGLF